MQMCIIATFKCSFDEWKSIYDGDYELRKQFMKDDVVGRVSKNCAMIKTNINPTPIFLNNFIFNIFKV